MTRLTALVVGGLLVLLAGCSSDGDPAADASPSASGAPTSSPSGSPTSSEPAFNPCDGVDAAAVSRVLGAGVRRETGSTDTPRCALLPTEKGGPTFEMSYLWFDQGLEAAWKTMQVAGTVTRPTVRGADDARLVVNDAGKAYAVSGFLQNGSLIQTVNALALPPYDGPRVTRAVELILQQLSAARASR